MFGRFIEAVLDIIYPRICLACKNKLANCASIDNLVCLECWSKIKRNTPPFCRLCGRHMDKPQKNICPGCIKNPLYFDRAFSPCVYEGAIVDLIHEFKYKNKEHLGFTLSRLILEFIEEFNLDFEILDFIIPLPLHRARLREREFNQAQVISKYLAEKLNKPLEDNLLFRNRNSRTQTELETRERFLNVKGIFSVKKGAPLKGKNILLVDDVLTSGATSSEAAYALKQAGANAVFVLTLAN